jgi:hypothetical protein
MMKKIILISIPFLLALDSGETSYHNDEIIAFEQAVKRLQEAGCLEWERKRISLVTQTRETENKTIISGQVFSVECIKWPTTIAPLVSVKVSWTPPESRENGEALTAEEISHYEIHINEEVYISRGYEWIKEFQYGKYSLRMLAVDTEGLKSDLTQPVSFTVSG